MAEADSLDIVELVMAIEEAIGDDQQLSPAQREFLVKEIEKRFERGEFGDDGDLDDDALASLVRILGPRSPRGQAGAAAQPEEMEG